MAAQFRLLCADRTVHLVMLCAKMEPNLQEEKTIDELQKNIHFTEFAVISILEILSFRVDVKRTRPIVEFLFLFCLVNSFQISL